MVCQPKPVFLESMIMSSYTNELVLTPLPCGRKFKIVKEFTYAVGSKDSLDRITVPVGFITDLASIPRIFWRAVPVLGRHIKAAVLHDYLYAKSCRTRKGCDMIFLEAMKVSGVKRPWVLYRPVRMFGGRAWKNARS